MRTLSIGLALSATLSLTACLDDPELDDPALAATEQAIEGGYLADEFHLARAAKIPGCTATKLGPRHLLTALHCEVEPGDPVQLYDIEDGHFPGPQATTVQQVIRPGCTQWNDFVEDPTDCDGDFADVVVLRLNAEIPGPFATPAWEYPGSGRSGIKIGAGKHYDNPNLVGLLMATGDDTYTTDDSGGVFTTSEFSLNKGDSGGAFYFANRVLGVTFGRSHLSYYRARYTSVAHHLDFILDAMEYAWAGQPVAAGARTGTVLTQFTGSHQVCQLACERTSGCAAYSYSIPLSQCTHLKTAGTFTASAAFRSARK